MAGYKDIAAESPWVPDNGKPYEYHARRIYEKHFGHAPSQSLVDHWRECQNEGKVEQETTFHCAKCNKELDRGLVKVEPAKLSEDDFPEWGGRFTTDTIETTILKKDVRSYLEQDHVILTEVRWFNDNDGYYWLGRFHDTKTGHRGMTGSYYDLNPDGERLPKVEQTAELALYGWEPGEEYGRDRCDASADRGL